MTPSMPTHADASKGRGPSMHVCFERSPRSVRHWRGGVMPGCCWPITSPPASRSKTARRKFAWASLSSIGQVLWASRTNALAMRRWLLTRRSRAPWRRHRYRGTAVTGQGAKITHVIGVERTAEACNIDAAFESTLIQKLTCKISSRAMPADAASMPSSSKQGRRRSQRAGISPHPPCVASSR